MKWRWEQFVAGAVAWIILALVVIGARSLIVGC